MSTPLVSVIVPTYNCVGLLGECLKSIVAQNYREIEILVMDGGSTDGTVELARDYGERVRVLSERDRGIYDAMNKGIAKAAGEWLFFIGADDSFVDSSVVSDMMASEEAKDESTLMLYGDVYGEVFGGRYRGESTIDDVLRYNICHQAIFYRRRLFAEEASYDLRFRLYADWDLNLRISMRHLGSHRYVNRIVANYTGGASNAKDDFEFLDNRINLAWEYLADARGKPFAKEYLFSHYLDALKTAHMRGDRKMTKRIGLDMLRRTNVGKHLMPFLAKSAGRRMLPRSVVRLIRNRKRP